MHVVIVGLVHRDAEPAVKRLFNCADIKGVPVETTHGALTAYLFDARAVANRHLVVKEESKPISGAPKVVIGSKLIDGGYLIFDASERQSLIEREPAAAEMLRPYIGAENFINSGGRWIAALQKAPPDRLRTMPALMNRVAKVREFRLGAIPPKSKADDKKKEPGTSSRALAATPTVFHVTVIPAELFLAISEVSPERRGYTSRVARASCIPSNKLRLLPPATKWHFGVLTSRMHMAWTAHIGGRVKSDYQYGIGLNYNTFPWPTASAVQMALL